jgi:hypothetical protein
MLAAVYDVKEKKRETFSFDPYAFRKKTSELGGFSPWTSLIQNAPETLERWKRSRYKVRSSHRDGRQGNGSDARVGEGG